MYNLLFEEFIEACRASDINKFREILSSSSIENANELIAFDNYLCFHRAASNGQYNIVKAIIEYVESVTDEIPCEEAILPVFLARNGEGFKAALNNQHFKTVELILEQEFLISECMAIIEDNPEFIKTLWGSSLKSYILYLFSIVCGQDISLVKNLLEIIPKSSHHLLMEETSGFYTNEVDNNPFKSACVHGKLEVIQLLWSIASPSYRNKLVKTLFPTCYIAAAKGGHLEIIKQLLEWLNLDEKIELLTTEDFAAFIYAADKGYFEIIKCIWEYLPGSLKLEAISASNFAAYRLATKNKHPYIVEFLEANNTKEIVEKMKNAINQGPSSR